MNTYTEFLMNMQEFTNALPEYPQSNSPALNFVQYWKKELFQPDELFLQKYKTIIEEEQREVQQGAWKPFLSVVIRTQGNREAMLRETFLALYGQSDEDFEVVLVKHKATPEADAMVEEIVADQPESLRKRVRTYALNEGNRTTPINFGIAHTRGDYVVILDDDDIVFDHWVEEFHKAAKINNGCILHSYIAVQSWEVLENDKGEQSMRATGKPDNIYCCDFSFADQYRTNYCPLMGLAFPGFLFREFGKCFDESLSTAEDWEFQMRFVFLLGVADIKTPTAIYRKFGNAANASTIHNEKEWHRNHVYVIDKALKMPRLLMPESWSDALASRRGLPPVKKFELDGPPILEFAQLYYKDGDSFSEKQKIRGAVLNTPPFFDVGFDLSENEKAIKGLRFDPADKGLFGIKDFYYSIAYADGSRLIGSGDDIIATNGCVYNENHQAGIWFEVLDDPWIEFPADETKIIKEVHVFGWKSDYIPAKTLYKRTKDGCITENNFYNYSEVYDAYMKRLQYFKAKIEDEKDKEIKLGISAAATIAELEQHYKDYCKYLHASIKKDQQWAKGHSRKGIVIMQLIKVKFRKEIAK